MSSDPWFERELEPVLAVAAGVGGRQAVGEVVVGDGVAQDQVVRVEVVLVDGDRLAGVDEAFLGQVVVSGAVLSPARGDGDPAEPRGVDVEVEVVGARPVLLAGALDAACA